MTVLKFVLRLKKNSKGTVLYLQFLCDYKIFFCLRLRNRWKLIGKMSNVSKLSNPIFESNLKVIQKRSTKKIMEYTDRATFTESNQ